MEDFTNPWQNISQQITDQPNCDSSVGFTNAHEQNNYHNWMSHQNNTYVIPPVIQGSSHEQSSDFQYYYSSNPPPPQPSFNYYYPHTQGLNFQTPFLPSAFVNSTYSPEYSNLQVPLVSGYLLPNALQQLAPSSTHVSASYDNPPEPIQPPPPPLPQTYTYNSNDCFGPSSRILPRKYGNNYESSPMIGRPKKFCIILRGLPGSGKSTVARQIRDIEKNRNESVRILSIDDYFLSDYEDNEELLRDVTYLKMNDTKSLATYNKSLEKSLKRTVDEGKFDVLIVDACHITLDSFEALWGIARSGGYECVIGAIDIPIDICMQRLLLSGLISEKQLENVKGILSEMSNQWEDPLPHMSLLDLGFFLSGGESRDVEMEEDDILVVDSNNNNRNQPVMSFNKEDDYEEASRQICETFHHTNLMSMPASNRSNSVSMSLEGYASDKRPKRQGVRYSNSNSSSGDDDDDVEMDDSSSVTQSFISTSNMKLSSSALNSSAVAKMSLSSLSGCLKRVRSETAADLKAKMNIGPDHAHSNIHMNSNGNGEVDTILSTRKRRVHWGDFKVIEIENTAENSLRSHFVSSSENKAKLYNSLQGKDRFVRPVLVDEDDDEDEDVEYKKMLSDVHRGRDKEIHQMNYNYSSSVGNYNNRGFELRASIPLSATNQIPSNTVQAPSTTVQEFRMNRSGRDRDRAPMFRSANGNSPKGSGSNKSSMNLFL